MATTALEALFVTDTHRRYFSSTGGDGVPFVQERVGTREEGPFVVTNSKGSFVPSVVRPGNLVWAAYAPCPAQSEDTLVSALYQDLWQLSVRNAWGNRCTSVPEAVQVMAALGYEAKHVVVPVAELAKFCGREMTVIDVQRLMFGQGFVAEFQGLKVLASTGIPAECALLAAMPTLLGEYTRIADSVSIMLRRSSTAVALVGP